METELREIVESVLEMSKTRGFVAEAGAQERLIQAVQAGKRALLPPVIKVVCGPDSVPTRAHSDDAGLDLYVERLTRIPPGEFVDVHLGITSIEFPTGWWGRILGRSSTLRNRNLFVTEGTIDEGYRGPLFAGVYNLSGSVRYAQPGERIAQLVLVRTPPPVEIQRVAAVAPSERGTNGFGSTGA